MAPTVVRLQNAGHSYDGGVWQFRHLELEMRRGEILAILGPNGRGKSTFLRVIASLIRLNEARVDAASAIGFVP
jgi:iron complex transport system ATP-binding protein